MSKLNKSQNFMKPALMNEIFDQEIHMSKVECGTQIEQNYAHLYLRQMELDSLNNLGLQMTCALSIFHVIASYT